MRHSQFSVQLGFGVQLHVRLLLSLALFSSLGLYCLMFRKLLDTGITHDIYSYYTSASLQVS